MSLGLQYFLIFFNIFEILLRFPKVSLDGGCFISLPHDLHDSVLFLKHLKFIALKITQNQTIYIIDIKRSTILMQFWESCITSMSQKQLKASN